MRILWQLTNKKVSIDNLRGGHNYNVQNLTKYLAWSQQNLHPHIFRCTPETDPVLTPPSRVRLPKTVSGKQMVLHENSPGTFVLDDPRIFIFTTHKIDRY